MVAGWKCPSSLHSFEFSHGLFKTVKGQFHSTAWPLQHRAQKNSSIGRYRTGVRLLAVRRLHWAIPSFPARQVPFGSLSLGWHLLIVCRYLKAIDVIDAQFWCEFSRNCFLQPFQASCWEHWVGRGSNFFWSFCQASQAPKDSVTAGQAAGTVTAGILH